MEVVIAATGLLGLILMGISALVFVLFMELTVARARPALQLLLQLGYQPAFLRTFMARRFVPMMLGAVAAAILLAGGAQWLVSGRLQDLQLKLPVFPGLPFWITAALSVLLLLVQVRTSVRRAMRTF